MFFHRQELQFKAKPSSPDAVFARNLQEVLGGQYGEITVAMQYAFQGWNMHIPGKYRDLVFGIAAEEFGHVEMLAVMIAQLLEKQPLGVSGKPLQDDPTVAAVLGGMDRQHAIVAGAAARAVDFADGRSESVGESRSRVLLHRWGVGPSSLQFEVRGEGGLLVARTDFAWEEHGLLGEFDGRVKYGRLLRPGQDPGDAVFEEKRREDAVRDEGWGVTRWVWADFGAGHRLAARVRRAQERTRR